MKRIINRYPLVCIVLLILGGCTSPKNSEQTAAHSITFGEIPRAILPSLYADGQKLYLSWVDTISMPGRAKLSIAELIDTTLHGEITLASGQNWFINWADFPTVAVNGNNVLAHFLVNSSASKMAYDIKYRVQDLAAPTGKFNPLNTDSTASEHGFVSMLPLTDTSFFVTWLDGRNMKGGLGHSHHGLSGAMNVRAAEINLKGEIRAETVLDHMACTCCQTTSTLTSRGPVVLYRDCTIDNIRDIVITRRIGKQWTEPRPIHLDGWKIEGCPVNGPKADAAGDTMVVGWYTGARGEAKVQVAFSTDAGATFLTPIVLSKKQPLGRLDVKMIGTQQAVVSWMESDQDDTFLFAQRVAMDKAIGSPVKIARVSASRKTGFPQMEIVGEKMYFAWTDPQVPAARVKIANLDLSAL